jgi:hypothetical protein
MSPVNVLSLFLLIGETFPVKKLSKFCGKSNAIRIHTKQGDVVLNHLVATVTHVNSRTRPLMFE